MSGIEEYDANSIDRLRERVFAILQSNYANDNIDGGEFERRLDVANKADSRVELEALIADLPVIQDPGEPMPEEDAPLPNVNYGEVKESSTMVNIFSGSDRKGMWRPPRNLTIACVFGGSDLDFRQAKLPPGKTHINIGCVFGGCDIIVGRGINVEVNGIGIFGAFDNKAPDETHPSWPTLIVKGFAVFGGVDVKYKPYD